MAGAEFEGERADKCGAADGDRHRYRDMSVGVAHVGLDSGDQSVGYQTEDAKQQAEAHASGGEDERSEEDADCGGEQQRGFATLGAGRYGGGKHSSLGYILRYECFDPPAGALRDALQVLS